MIIPDAQYPYYPLDTLPYFPFLCQHFIPVFKVMPSLQVLKLVCILLSVILLNNLHTQQFFKNHPFFV